MTQSFALSPHLDTAAAPPLAEALLALRGADLCVDARDTTFIGALGLQVLVSARLQWAEDGHIFQVSPVNEGFRAAAEGLGVPLTELGADDDAAPRTEAEGTE